MAIELVGYKTYSSGGLNAANTNLVLTDLIGGTDSAPQPGDMVLVVYNMASNEARNPTIYDPAVLPYTQLAYTSSAGIDIDVANITVSYKFMGYPADTSLLIGPDFSLFYARVVFVYVFRGVDYPSVTDVAPVYDTRRGNLVNPSAITPTTPNVTLVVAGCVASYDNINGTFPLTHPTGSLATFHGVGSRDEDSCMAGIGLKQDWNSGTYDSSEWGFDGGQFARNTNTSVVLALRPRPPAGNGIRFVGMHKGSKVGTSSLADTVLPLDRNLTGGYRTYVREGDFVVAFSTRAGNGADTADVTTAGYTLLTTVTENSANSTPSQIRVYYKFMGATPDTSVSYEETNSVIAAQFFGSMVFSGVDPVNPWDVLFLLGKNAVGKDANPVSITPITPGAFPLAVAATAHENATATPYDAPADLEGFFTAGQVDTDCVSGGFGFDSDWVSGPKTFSTWTLPITSSATSQCVTYVSMVLRPEFPSTGGSGGGYAKHWNGTAWSAKPVKFWNGTSWTIKPLKRWNGSAWITTPY